MAKSNRLMSEQLKEQLARELGVADKVRRDGWGAISSRDCGRLVQLAIRRAEERMQSQA